MYKYLGHKNGKYLIKFVEDKTIEEFSTYNELIDFFAAQDILDISDSFIDELLVGIKDQAFYFGFFEKLLPKLLSTAMLKASKPLFDAVKNNLSFIDKISIPGLNKDTFNNLLYILNNSMLVKLYTQYKNSNSLSLARKALIVEKIENDKIKLDFLNSSPDMADDIKVLVVTSSKNDKFKLEFLKNNPNLDIEQKIDIVQTFNDKFKLEFLKNNPNLDDKQKAEIVAYFKNDESKLKFLKNNPNFDIEQKIDIVQTFKNDKFKLEFLKNNPNLDDKQKAEIVADFKNDEFKIDFLEKNPNVSSDAKYDILITVEDEKFKLEFVDKDTSLDDVSKIDILLTCQEDTIVKAFCSNKYNMQALVPLEDVCSCFPKKTLLDYIDNHLSNLSAITLERLADNVSLDTKTEIIELLEKNTSRLAPDQLFYYINNCDSGKKERFFNEYQDKFRDVQKYIVLNSLQQDFPNNDYSNLLDNIQLSTDARKIINKILENFGLTIFYSSNTDKLWSQTCMSYFNDNILFLLVKYFAYTNKLADLSKLNENPQLFVKFQEFRVKNLPQNNQDVINIHNSIAEFNQYFSLIEDCLEHGMTEKEQTIFIRVLTDKKIQISSKQELQNYATARSAYIDKLAETEIDSAIIYLLTSLDSKAYNPNGLFISDQQLNITASDFSEELKDKIILIQSAKEIINIISNEPIEIKKKILQTLKQDLEAEFTQSGSVVADLRNAFPEFESEVRTLYGKELHDSLQSSTLPPATSQNGVDVIALNGEDFKLLVHGLNAYGQGSAVFENRNIGRSYICTSLISDTHLERANAKIYYGFKNISSKSLALEGPHDISSYGKDNSLEINSYRSGQFMKTEQFLEKSMERYNEVVLYRDQTDEAGNIKPLMPDYIVAFNEISERDREEAKRLNVPIILINEETYKNRKNAEVETAKIVTTTPEIKASTTEEAISDKVKEAMKIIETASQNCSAHQEKQITLEIQEALNTLSRDNTKGGELNAN